MFFIQILQVIKKIIKTERNKGQSEILGEAEEHQDKRGIEILGGRWTHCLLFHKCLGHICREVSALNLKAALRGNEQRRTEWRWLGDKRLEVTEDT